MPQNAKLRRQSLELAPLPPRDLLGDLRRKAAAARPATADAGPVVLYGALRSGTTLLRLILDMHPGLSCPGETDFLFDHLRPSGDGWVLDHAALAADRIFLDKNIPMPTAHDGATAVAQMVTALAARKPQSRLVLVLHRNLDRALQLLPRGPVLHLLRDPRDVAPSSVKMGWAGDVYHAVQHWKDTEQSWTAAAPALSQRQNLELRYEALVNAPEDELGALCAALDMPYDPAMLRFHETSSYEPIDAGLSSQWRKKLPVGEIALIEAAVGDMIGARGYEHSGLPPMRLTGARLAAVRLRGKLAATLFRARRHGLRDTLLVTLANRTGIEGAARGARRRMAKTELLYLK